MMLSLSCLPDEFYSSEAGPPLESERIPSSAESCGGSEAGRHLAQNERIGPSRVFKRKGKDVTQETKNARKRIHGCWLCEKSFDRPSTLKKVSSISFS